MKTAAIIVAAGRGSRARADGPKQWQPLLGRRVADWTLAAFDQHPGISEIVLVHHTDDDCVVTTQTPLSLAIGGDTRDASVANGLAAIRDPQITHVLIHDVARPCVSQEVITRVLGALQSYPGAAPALEVTDALWHGEDGVVTGTRDRTGLYRAQTPQGFDLTEIRAAHAAKKGPAADDVAVARAAGLAVAIVPGEERNIKITLPADFARAESILRG